MAKKRYIVKLRRGKKETDANGVVTRDDWAKYTAESPDEATPQDAELVLEYDNGVPRLKIDNGHDPFSALPYIGMESCIG